MNATLHDEDAVITGTPHVADPPTVEDTTLSPTRLSLMLQNKTIGTPLPNGLRAEFQQIGVMSEVQPNAAALSARTQPPQQLYGKAPAAQPYARPLWSGRRPASPPSPSPRQLALSLPSPPA